MNKDGNAPKASVFLLHSDPFQVPVLCRVCGWRAMHAGSSAGRGGFGSSLDAPVLLKLCVEKAVKVARLALLVRRPCVHEPFLVVPAFGHVFRVGRAVLADAVVAHEGGKVGAGGSRVGVNDVLLVREEREDLVSVLVVEDAPRQGVGEDGLGARSVERSVDGASCP